MRRLFLAVITTVAGLVFSACAESQFLPAPAATMPIRTEGYALFAKDFFFWGNGIYRYPLPLTAGGKPEQIAAGTFLEGGCALDVNGDGRTDVVAIQVTQGHPELVWFEAPLWKRHIIDRGVDARDMLPATLLGKRGILLIHKRMQVRFYEIPSRPEELWHETEIYSFYTPSEEGGLALADVNRDGRVDILAGNYFIESPTAFELPWHLWAIDVWSETAPSATLRVAWVRIGGETTRVALQREMPNARFAWFEKQTDFKKLWTAHAIGAEEGLQYPHTLLVGDFTGKGRDDLVVAESADPGRIMLYRNTGADFGGATLAQGHHWMGAFLLGGEMYAFDDRELFRIALPLKL